VSDVLLALDVGGTNLRATLIDGVGRRIAAAVADTRLVVDVPPLGRRYEPESLWRAACSAIRGAVTQADVDVAAVAATGQRLACAFLDAGGETLYVGPNTDARGVMTGWQVEEAGDGRLYDRTGRGMPLLFAPARLLWFRENEPGMLERVDRVVGLGDWLAHRLCGEVGIELTGAVELLAVDVYSGEYWPELWSRLELDPGWLPPILPVGSRLGALSTGAAAATGLRAGIPVAVSPPDSMAALVGSGAAPVGHTAVLAGSTMPVLGSAERPVADPERRTWTGRHPIAGRGVIESNAGTTGFGWAWMVERLVGPIAGLDGDAAYERAESLAAASPPGARDSLSFGGGASVMNATTPATFLTMYRAAFWPAPYVEPDVAGGDLLRACLEAIAFSARANLEQVEAARGGPSDRLILAEGMARSRLFRQLVADVTGRPVHVPAVLQATSVGAAMCAAVAAGLYADLGAATESMTRADLAAEPDATVAGALDAAYRQWRALYAKIESL